ncbi:uncharacterized protein LOC143902189 [Temnothorax americanus]|uniref:uncharacterized protein LOC143902189 n=1 Tax=Temnothorax americanus TaxID=1964332 RepID=UPI0040686EE0
MAKHSRSEIPIWLQWVRAYGRLDLEPKGPEYAHQNCRLCHLHFENKWYKINKVRARLHPDAVPTIFFGPGFQQQDNTAPEQTTQQNEENVVKEKVNRNTCAEATVAEMQVQEDNSKAETSHTIVPIIVSDVEITQPAHPLSRSLQLGLNRLMIAREKGNCERSSKN